MADESLQSSIVSRHVDPMVGKLTVLHNSGPLCYRNSVFHSLFSIRRFVQLLEAGKELLSQEDPQRPLYNQLLEVALRFRKGDPTVGSAEATEAVWHTITNTPGYPDNPTAEIKKEGFKGDAMDQEDAPEFLEYILNRLTTTELPLDLFNLEYGPQDENGVVRHAALC